MSYIGPFPIILKDGGTNAALTASNGGIFYSTASAGAILPGTSTANQLLMSGASTTPAWSTTTYPATNAINTLLYASSANVMTALATINGGTLTTSSGGVPTWLAAGTSGIPLIGQGAGTPPIYGTVAIAGGGTNATSFTQSAGIVVYNGTSLVNYAGPQINSSGVHTNTAQPAFHAYVNTNVGSVTGDGTAYTLIYNSTLFDNASNFTTGSGTFTAPVTGRYQFNISVCLYSLTASYTLMTLDLVTTGGTYELMKLSPGKIYETASGSTVVLLSGSVLVSMTATNTATVVVTVSGSSKSIGVGGGASLQNKFSGFLVC